MELDDSAISEYTYERTLLMEQRNEMLKEMRVSEKRKGKMVSFSILFYSFLQGIPTSLGYPKCNVLKLRKVCERSELRLQNIDPIKRGEF